MTISFHSINTNLIKSNNFNFTMKTMKFKLIIRLCTCYIRNY